MGTQNTGPGRLILRPIAGCSGNIADRGVGRGSASRNVTRERPKTALAQVTPIAGLMAKVSHEIVLAAARRCVPLGVGAKPRLWGSDCGGEGEVVGEFLELVN